MKFFKKINQNIFYNSSLTLTDLANLFETDKGDADKSKLSWADGFPNHFTWGYTKEYEKYMHPQKNKNINLLEIGICDRRFPYASIKMWLSFFENIDLYCIDNFWGSKLIDKKQDIKLINKLGANFIYSDQGNSVDWDEINFQFKNKFDFIIDDGSHWPNHISFSLFKCKNILKNGGYYFIEDLMNPDLAKRKFTYDNTLLTEDLLESKKNGNLFISFLNKEQNLEIKNSFELIDMVLSENKLMYLAIFKKNE